MFFSESGWDTILAIYVTEAEGRSVDVERLAALLGKSVPITDRWITALLRADVLEIEYGNPQAEAAKSYRLTAETHRKLEQFLARDHRQ
jgi:Mn-dependent DtxR family transcriptional regulator